MEERENRDSELINQFFFLLLFWKRNRGKSNSFDTIDRLRVTSSQLIAKFLARSRLMSLLSPSINPRRGKIFKISPFLFLEYRLEGKKKKLLGPFAVTATIIIIPSSLFLPGFSPVWLKLAWLLAGKKLRFNYTRLISDRVSRSRFAVFTVV